MKKMKKLNKDLKVWQKRLSWEYYDKEYNKLTMREQQYLMETILPQEIDREPYKTK